MSEPFDTLNGLPLPLTKADGGQTALVGNYTADDANKARTLLSTLRTGVNAVQTTAAAAATVAGAAAPISLVNQRVNNVAVTATSGALSLVVPDDTFVAVNLNADLTINAPTFTSGSIGAGRIGGVHVTLIFTQDSTGGRKTTFASGVKAQHIQPRQGPSQVSAVHLVSRTDGTWHVVSHEAIDTLKPIHVKDFGALGDWNQSRGTGRDDAICISKAITFASGLNTGTTAFAREIQIGGGVFRIASSITNASIANGGFPLHGEGRQATRLMWDGPASTGPGTQPIIRVNSAQFVTLSNFTLWGYATNTPSEGIFFDYNPEVDVGTAITLQSLLMDGVEANGCFEYGVRYSNLFGNNSEVRYFDVTINKYSKSGVSLEGSQQKSHTFYGCSLNGAWDGITGHVGGETGIDTSRGTGGSAGQGGAYSFYGGNVTANKVADFMVGAVNDPILISGVESEGSFRFIDMGSAPTSASRCLTVTNNRMSDDATNHAGDMIRLVGSGSFTILDNEIGGASVGSLPYINFQFGAMVKGSVRRNRFASTGSAAQAGVRLSPGGAWSGLDVGDNSYFNSSNATQEQIEFLNTNNETPYSFPTDVSLYRSDYPGHQGKPCILTMSSAFTTAGLSQSLKIWDIPRGVKVKGIYLYPYNAFEAPSLITATVKLGTTSGGSEFILPQNVIALPTYYGHQPSHLGTALTTNFAQGGYIGDFENSTPLYATITTTGANVNTFTGGNFFVMLDVEHIQRFVA